VHEPTRAFDNPAEVEADALMSKTDAQQGTLAAKCLMMSLLTPPSLGVQGPGEMTMCVGRSASTSATVILSFRKTFSGSFGATSPNFWTRL
jgi:hypothetical protein